MQSYFYRDPFYTKKNCTAHMDVINLHIIQLIQLRLTSAIVKWQMCNIHERKK